ncbi:MAG: hypothetical protein Sup05_0025 [uncultured Candidatus Thioglobus sp.]|nr:MAG: hypothetical protein Sup05_0025 [uncultured Candidatus Thioglobus sp.]
MKLSAEVFKHLKNKNLTLLGMSGVGKTHLAKLLSGKGKWFHYSGDYRIGAKYLNDDILSSVKQKNQTRDRLVDGITGQSVHQPSISRNF